MRAFLEGFYWLLRGWFPVAVVAFTADLWVPRMGSPMREAPFFVLGFLVVNAAWRILVAVMGAALAAVEKPRPTE